MSAATVSFTGPGRVQSLVETAGIGFAADEPLDAGGTGTGPSPYDLLCSALGACTVMTLRMYAETKGWALPAIKVEVTHAKDKTATPADQFTRRITLPEGLDEAQRKRLLDIADRCPVHRTLTTGATITTTTGATITTTTGTTTA